MKLVYAIVSDDSVLVSKLLTKSGFFATKLASSGRFLLTGLRRFRR